MSLRIPRRDTKVRFVTKFGENQPLRSCRKVMWITTQKNSRCAGVVPAQHGPITPKIALTLSPLDMSAYTEFGLDWLRFAGLILERLIFRPKKSIQLQHTIIVKLQSKLNTKSIVCNFVVMDTIC